MRSGGNILNYFSENKLNKLANLVQFKRMLVCFVWSGSLSTPLACDEQTCGVAELRV